MPTVPEKKGITLARIPGTAVPAAHTLFGYTAFLSALIIGTYLHYYKIVKNGVASYPDEWFPSVSATTGDWYPERNICQIFIALTSGPRIALCYLWYLLIVRNVPANGSKGFAKFLFANDFIRTVACGGWVYITSSDDHDIHDIAMAVYLICTLPHVIGTIKTAPQNPRAHHYRKLFAFTFFGAMVPMVYFFIQHNVHRVPGAYTYYAFFEWSLIISDLAFDAVCMLDFATLEVRIVDVGMPNAGGPSLSPALKTFGGNKTLMSQVRPMDVLSFVTDVYLGFIFWSMFTSVPLMIWYFPLWHMGISGYEAFLFCNLAVFLLGLNFIRRRFERSKGFFHLLSLIGVLSYKIQDPANRLIAVAAGVAISLLTWGATLFGQRLQPGRSERGALTLALGLLMNNVVKQAWWANNPIWPIMNENNGGANMIGLILGVLASIQVMLRKEPGQEEHRNVESSKKSESWLLSGLGGGAYFFMLHTMYGDSSIISRWSLGGYPNTGPHPVPGGFMVIIAMSVGLLLSSKHRWATSLIWWAIGSVGLAVLHVYEGDFSFAGGVVYTIYALSLFPTVIRSMFRQPPGRTFFIAMLIYNVLALAHVWTVAYAFVPGGEVLRERTDYVLIAMQSLILLSVYNANTIAWSALSEARVSSVFSAARLNAKLTLIGLVVASASICYRRLPKTAPQPHHPEHKLITAGIWTIHFAIDNDMWNSEIRMRDAIRDLELDVIGLLESDLQRTIMGNRDLTQFLSEDLNMYADYGPGPTKHTWGCTMLSKFPIKRSSHHLLPSPKGELACAIHATLDVYGKEVDVIVSHNGQEEDFVDRQLQTTELGRIMRESDNPFLFLGYVVTRPGDENEIYRLLMNGGHVHDVEVSDWDRWCQYLAFRGVKRVGYARVSHGGITDTEIQIGKYTLLEDHPTSWDKNQSIEEFKKEERYQQIDESAVPAGLRFPAVFYGQGIRGHRFHVFDRPIYYA
ncbi:hypothetical protein DFQ26_008239 [Actinomortierella ambigua]|nr:hypothetical protein DFQ26_008239 [Actinomortierella ambigua]